MSNSSPTSDISVLRAKLAKKDAIIRGLTSAVSKQAELLSCFDVYRSTESSSSQDDAVFHHLPLFTSTPAPARLQADHRPSEPFPGPGGTDPAFSALSIHSLHHMINLLENRVSHLENDKYPASVALVTSSMDNGFNLDCPATASLDSPVDAGFTLVPHRHNAIRPHVKLIQPPIPVVNRFAPLANQSVSSASSLNQPAPPVRRPNQSPPPVMLPIQSAPPAYSPNQSASPVSSSNQSTPPVKPPNQSATPANPPNQSATPVNSSNHPAPSSILIIGDSITRNIKLKTRAEIVCLPGARVPDIEATLRVLTRSHSQTDQAKSHDNIILFVGTNNARFKQSEVTKYSISRTCAFASKMSRHQLIVSGPLPVTLNSDIFSRLYWLNIWLAKHCAENGYLFLDNWPSFRRKTGMLKVDGIHPTPLGASTLSNNLDSCISQSKSLSQV